MCKSAQVLGIAFCLLALRPLRADFTIRHVVLYKMEWAWEDHLVDHCLANVYYSLHAGQYCV
jgi:hypothetical protein